MDEDDDYSDYMESIQGHRFGFVRDLDTITEVSETSFSTALRSQDDDDSSSFILYSGFVWKPGVQNGNGAKSDEEVAEGWCSQNQARNEAGCDGEKSLETEREHRLIQAYQHYHQSKEALDELSSTSSLSSSSLSGFAGSKESDEDPCKDYNRNPGSPSAVEGACDCAIDSLDTTVGFIRFPRANLGDRLNESSPTGNELHQINKGITRDKGTIVHPRSSLPFFGEEKKSGVNKRGHLDAWSSHRHSIFPRQTGHTVVPCTAKAVSTAIVKDQSPVSGPKFFSPSSHRILGEAIAEVIDPDPYSALAKATVEAASKAIRESSERLHEDENAVGTLSLTVKSILTGPNGTLLKPIDNSPRNLIGQKIDTSYHWNKSRREKGSGIFVSKMLQQPDFIRNVRYMDEDTDIPNGLRERNNNARVTGDAEFDDTYCRHSGEDTEELLPGFLRSDNLRKLISPPYYATSTSVTPTSMDESVFTDYESSAVMDDTATSMTSNRSNRPLSKDNPWRLWDRRWFRQEPVNYGEEKPGRFIKFKPKLDRGRHFHQRIPNYEVTTTAQDANPFLQAHLPAPPAVSSKASAIGQYDGAGTPNADNVTLIPQRAKFEREYEPPERKETVLLSDRRVPFTNPGIFCAKIRALSTGVLESEQSQMKKSIVETDLDQVQKNMETTDRAKSADRLFDKASKVDLAPPENELKKSAIGETGVYQKESTTISEHELRFQKSTDRLHIPDWYLHSKYFRRGAQTSSLSSSVISSPAVQIRIGGGETKITRGRPNESVENQDEINLIDNATTIPSTRTHWEGKSGGDPDQDQPTSDFHVPKFFFDKYKDEIEEWRSSRMSIIQSPMIHQSNGYAISERRPVPVATVRPTPARAFSPGSVLAGQSDFSNRSIASGTCSESPNIRLAKIARVPSPSERTEKGDYGQQESWNAPSNKELSQPSGTSPGRFDFPDRSINSTNTSDPPRGNGTNTKGPSTATAIKSTLKAVKRALSAKEKAFDRSQVSRQGSRRSARGSGGLGDKMGNNFIRRQRWYKKDNEHQRPGVAESSEEGTLV